MLSLYLPVQNSSFRFFMTDQRLILWVIEVFKTLNIEKIPAWPNTW